MKTTESHVLVLDMPPQIQASHLPHAVKDTQKVVTHYCSKYRAGCGMPIHRNGLTACGLSKLGSEVRASESREQGSSNSGGTLVGIQRNGN